MTGGKVDQIEEHSESYELRAEVGRRQEPTDVLKGRNWVLFPTGGVCQRQSGLWRRLIGNQGLLAGLSFQGLKGVGRDDFSRCAIRICRIWLRRNRMRMM